ncbi:MAG: spore coat protein CotH, partial [Bradymonadia bacterium]
DRAGLMVDAFKYDDAFPWPIGADALGASTLWLPADWLPVEDHALRGRSLQRRSFDAVTADPANWEASALDAADPGSVATVSTGEVPGTVVEVQFNNGALGALTPDAPVSLQVRLTGAARAGLRVEWFADDVQVEGEPVAVIPLIDAGEGLWTATLPAQPDQTIVRARIVADSGVVSPRPHDPMAWHAAFVATPIPGATRPYRLYINTDQWTALWDAVAGGRVLNGCVPNPGWALRVPAVFVHEGRVFDVRIRYQGSRWNRTRGRNIANWEAPGPDRPGPLSSLSWSVRFPRYAPFDGRSAIILNKLTQGCPGLSAGVGFGLFDAVGLPTPQVRFTRLFINGQYYNYNLELERPGEEMLNRWLADTAADNPGAVPEPGVPHLFKSGGCNCNEGPYGWGDGRPLEPHCEYSADERYASTYERKTWAWAGHDALRALIESHEVARSGTDAELAAFLADHFDVDLMLNYLAVINWAVPFDDMFHNHYWVQRRSDDRWFLAPWDLDQNFGGWKGPNASIYIGASGDRDNRAGWWHRVKDSFLRVYRAQYIARLAELNETTLHPDAVIARVDAIEAAWRLPEVEAAPAGRACDFTGQAENFRRFARARHDVVEASTAPP